VSDPLPGPVLEVFGADGRPDARAFHFLHRGGDSYVRLMRRDDPQSGRLAPLPAPYGSVPVAQLRDMFPQFVEFILADGYLSVNSFYRPATHASRDVRYLNAVFADLDYHKAGASTGQAVGMVIDAVEARIIPAPTVLVYSGRGLWVMFLLVDPESALTGHRVTGWADPAHFTYHQVMRALHRRLAAALPKLNPDPGAIDAGRVMRVPGSFSAAGAGYVRFLVLGDRTGGTLPTYTLESLAAFYGVEHRAPELPQRIAARDKQPRALAGWRGRWRVLLHEIELLESHRGGFHEGTRNAAVFLVARCLVGIGCSDAEIEREIVRMSRECRTADGRRRSPLDEKEWRHQLKAAVKAHRRGDVRGLITYARAAELLDVSPVEVEHLGLEKLRPDFDSSRVEHYQRTRPTSAARRAAILELVRERFGGIVPRVRDMAAELAKLGHSHALGTVQGDYSALELNRERLHQRGKLAEPHPKLFTENEST